MSEEPKRSGQKPPVQTSTAWVDWADNDLAFAQWGLESEQPFAKQICFLCHQAAEKYLKGYLIAQGWVLEKTHDISKLLTTCLGYNEAFAQFEDDLAPLNEYIVEARYPADVHIDFSLEEAKRAVEVTQRVRDFVQATLANPQAE